MDGVVGLCSVLFGRSLVACLLHTASRTSNGLSIINTVVLTESGAFFARGVRVRARVRVRVCVCVFGRMKNEKFPLVLPQGGCDI